MKFDSFNDLSKQDKSDFLIALGVITLALFFIVGMSFNVLKMKIDIDATELHSSNKATAGIQGSSIAYAPLNTDKKEAKRTRRTYDIPEKIERRSAYVIRSEEESLYIDLNNSIESGNNALSIEQKQIENVQVREMQKKSTTAVTDVRKVGDRVIASTPIVANSTDIKEQPLSTKDDESCIITIGSFGKNYNIQNLKQSLKASGFKIFQEPDRTLTRIGVYHSCDERKLNSTLKLFQKRYAKDAFIMRK